MSTVNRRQTQRGVDRDESNENPTAVTGDRNLLHDETRNPTVQFSDSRMKQ